MEDIPLEHDFSFNLEESILAAAQAQGIVVPDDPKEPESAEKPENEDNKEEDNLKEDENTSISEKIDKANDIMNKVDDYLTDNDSKFSRIFVAVFISIAAFYAVFKGKKK